MTCQELLRAVDPYLDNELAVIDILRVQGHLVLCESCRTAMESEAQLHALLTADAIQEDAPSGLRDRILQRVTAAPALASLPGSGRRFLVWPSAVLVPFALLALLLAVFAMSRARGPENVPPFAVEVAAKHRLYTEDATRPLDMTTTEVAVLAGWLGQRVGVSITAPQLAQPGEHLVGGRVSSVADVPAAYLLYQRADHRVSLFIMPRPRREPEGHERVVDGVELYTAALPGLTVMWWDDDERRYAAASTTGVADLTEFARLCIRSRGASGDAGRARG